MTGVTILDTMEIYTLSWWQFVIGFIPLIIAAVVSVICMCIAFKKDIHTVKEIYITVLGGILSLALLMYLGKCCPADYLETRYKVEVSESASFLEFHNTYEIVAEHSDYFVVRERSKP